MSTYASESIIGPPSDRIYIKEFLSLCAITRAAGGTDLADALESSWNEYTDTEKRSIEEECSTLDFQKTLEDTISDPFHYAHLMRYHDTMTGSMQSALLTTHTKTKAKKGRRPGVPAAIDEAVLQSDVMDFHEKLNNISLKCWLYPPDAGLFLSTQKISDLNTIIKPKRGSSHAENPDALIFISVYNRLSWGNHLSCSSQHAVLASQTIGDLYDVIPCVANELPLEIEHNARSINILTEKDATPVHRGSVICIEGVAYGDGQSEDDYSDKLLHMLNLKPEKSDIALQKGVPMHDQLFSDLTIYLNKPYWLLHQGLCEHFLVFDAIRLLSPDDPQDGYPQTLFIAPPILDVCMACSRVPATLSIIGDVRLGQSPYKICKPCWDTLGQPDPSAGVKAVLVSKHLHGW